MYMAKTDLMPQIVFKEVLHTVFESILL